MQITAYFVEIPQDPGMNEVYLRMWYHPNMATFQEQFKKQKKVVIENNTSLKGLELLYCEDFYSRVTESGGSKVLDRKFVPLSDYQGKMIVKEAFHEIEFTVYAFKDDKLYVHFSLNDYVLDRKSPSPSGWKYGYDDGYSYSSKPVSIRPIYK